MVFLLYEKVAFQLPESRKTRPKALIVDPASVTICPTLGQIVTAWGHIVTLAISSDKAPPEPHEIVIKYF